MASKPAYALYNYARSSCSWRARIALEWKGIPYEYVVVNVLGGQQLRDEYAALNPNKRVPLLALGDGRVVAQSSAILEYLEEAHPDLPALLPPLSDPFARAQVRNLCGIICSDTQPLQSLGVQAKATEHLPESERATAKIEWMRYWIARGLRAVEKEITVTAGTYCLGDRVTLADVYLLPQVGNARLVDLDMGEFPIISKVVAALEQLPAFARSRPDAQPDAK